MEVVDGQTTIADVGGFVSKLDGIADEYGVTVQAFDARYVVDRAHLRRAVDLACRERSRGEAIATDPGVEILLYAAGRRQINQALEMGVRTGACPVVAVIVEIDEHDWTRLHDDAETDPATTVAEREAAVSVSEELGEESVLGAYDREQVCSFFDITGREIEATAGEITDLVRERVALLVVDR